jgi:glycosyltransferase involved in cell wall biosynthesis
MNATDSIILIEPNIGRGHNEIYLYHFTKVLLELNYTITVYSNPQVERLNKVIYRNVNYKSPFNLPSGFLKKKIVILLNLFITVYNISQLRGKGLKNQKIFFCCMDEYMHELLPTFIFNFLFPYRFSGLLLTVRNKEKRCFDRRNIIKSRYCRSIGILDESYCAKLSEIYKKPIIHFPDFTDDTSPNMKFSLIRDIKEKAKGRKIISLLGSIAPRKGYRTLIEAIDRLPENLFFFVIAGKPDLNKEEKIYIEERFSHEENCLFWDKNIPSESDFNALINISDIIYAAYVNFRQSSNLLAKASLFKKPLIVSKGSYMEEIIIKYKLGIAIEQHSITECVSAIIQLTDNKDAIRQAFFDDYLSINSYRNLKEVFSNIISVSFGTVL